MDIGKDFPVLKRKINGKRIIYFDNACMTLQPNSVIKAVERYYSEYGGCGGRSTHILGLEIMEKMDETRENMSGLINAEDPKEIIFTKNTTESINFVSNGFSFMGGEVVIGTDKEHNSNLIPWQILVKEKNIKRNIYKSNDEGKFDIESFKKVMNKDVKVVSVVHTSNLDGTTIPAKEIIEIAHDYGAIVLLDAAQSVPHKQVDVKKLDVDFLVFSVHKMMGPTGVGVLYGKYELLTDLKPLIFGGGGVKNSNYQNVEYYEIPAKFEVGLQNYAGLFSAGEAVDYIEKIGYDEIGEREIILNEYLTRELKDFVRIIGPEDYRERGSIFNFFVNGKDSYELAIELEESQNIMVRAGQHCVHSWYNHYKVPASVRVSLYVYNTLEDVKIFTETLKNILG